MATNLLVDGDLTVLGNSTMSTATGNPSVGATTSTSAAGAVTLNNRAGKITTETITTTGQSIYILTITNSAIAAADLCFASIANGSNTTGIPVVSRVTPAAGALAIVVANAATTATNPFGGSLVISFIDFKA